MNFLPFIIILLYVIVLMFLFMKINITLLCNLVDRVIYDRKFLSFFIILLGFRDLLSIIMFMSAVDSCFLGYSVIVLLLIIILYFCCFCLF